MPYTNLSSNHTDATPALRVLPVLPASRAGSPTVRQRHRERLSGAPGRRPVQRQPLLLRQPLMWHSLTRSRSPEYHRQTMMKLLAVAGVTFLLWQPLAPVRYVTADVLALTADQLRR